MAAAKIKPKKGKRKDVEAGQKTSSAEPSWARKSNVRRTERRFKPRSNSAALLAVLLSSAGALAAGAGFYSQFLRHVGPHSYGVPLLVAGAAAFLVGLVLQTKVVPAVRVGDAGLAVERSELIERLAWCDVDAVRLASGSLSFTGAGKVVTLSLSAHGPAAGFALAEARARIPKRAEGVDEQLTVPGRGEGELLTLEDAQVAGGRCHASGRLLSLEEDVRVCGACGQVYHHEELPPACLTCGAETV